MKCPKGTVEVSLWWRVPDSDDIHEYKSVYFDAFRDNTQGDGIIRDLHNDEDHPEEKALVYTIFDRLKPVLDLMTPRSDLSRTSKVYIFEPDEFESLTEGIEG